MRWQWHEKHGVRNGPILRKSDSMTPEQEERQERERHRRELDWIVHPEPGALYQETRTCAYCNGDGKQDDMRWTGRRWLCPQHFLEMLAGNIERIP